MGKFAIAIFNFFILIQFQKLGLPNLICGITTHKELNVIGWRLGGQILNYVYIIVQCTI